MTAKDNTQSDWIQVVIEQHARPLARYAASLLGDADRASDVVQDTLARLCREERSRVEGHLAEWLFTVCRNRALDVLRKEQRMTALSEAKLETEVSTAPSPAHETERRDTHRRVLRELSALPRNQQEVVRLKFQNGLSYEQISRVTKLTVTNVGFLIHTALKTLRRRLQADLELMPHPDRRMP